MARDSYGRDIISPILPPTYRFRGEPVPAPGNPPGGVPRYLKPIPFNTRNIERVFRAHITANEPVVMRWLYSTWTAQADAIKFQELRNAIRDGQFSADVMARWNEEYSDFVVNRLGPKWGISADYAHNYLAKGIRRAGVAAATFPGYADAMAAWTGVHGGELIVSLSDVQRDAVRILLQRFTVGQPMSADGLGRILRPAVGMTPKQVDALANYRESLLNAGNLSAATVENKVQGYAGRLIRFRARRIARTEISRALNVGAFETMRAANRSGELEGTVQKEFYTSKDERTCAFCGPLHGQVVGLEETFPGATKEVPNTYTPPVHPNCRCTIIYRMIPNVR